MSKNSNIRSKGWKATEWSHYPW